MLRLARSGAVLSLALFLVACGPPSSAELIRKAEKIQTKAELETALGTPEEVTKLGPIETWTYRTSDGTVSFLITGERVQLAAGGTQRK